MAKFNFRFDRVLNYKETIETLKKNQYGVVKQRFDKEEDKLRHINDYKNSVVDERNSSCENIKAGGLAMYNSYLNVLNDKIKIQEEVVLHTEHELEESKDEMIEAVKEKKMFVKLKENEFEQFVYEEKKEEDKIVDNLVSYRSAVQE